MGNRKRQSAQAKNEVKKSLSLAVLKNCPTSPRKMRLVADQIRGKSIDRALSILKFSPKEASKKLEKLVLSAISNWQSKNENEDIEKANLFFNEIKVDGGRMLKPICRPAADFANRSVFGCAAGVLLEADNIKLVPGVTVRSKRNVHPSSREVDRFHSTI